MSDLVPDSIVPWAPHPDAAPLCTREDPNLLIVAANGTRTCVGGWQLWSPPQIEVVPEPAPQRRPVRVSVVTGHAYARLGRTFATVQDEVQGSCIVDRKGEILAWNEGDRDWIGATVALEDGYRTYSGGSFRDVNWIQLRPHLYGAFIESDNAAPLR